MNETMNVTQQEIDNFIEQYNKNNADNQITEILYNAMYDRYRLVVSITNPVHNITGYYALFTPHDMQHVIDNMDYAIERIKNMIAVKRCKC